MKLPGKHGRTVAAAVVAAGVVVATLLFQGAGPPQAHPVPAADASPSADAIPVEGPIVDLKPTTLTLRDGAYLKVGVSLQLRGLEPGAAEVADEAVAEDFPTARAVDLVVSTYNEFTKKQLIPARGRAAAKKALLTRVAAAYNGEVTAVYLTTFAIQ